MREWYLAFEKRSSITSVERQRKGIVCIEFESGNDAYAFQEHLRRVLTGDWDGRVAHKPMPDAVTKERARKNIVEIFTLLSEHAIPEVEKVTLPAIGIEDTDFDVVRYRLTWEFASANKAGDLFQRLLWALN